MVRRATERQRRHRARQRRGEIIVPVAVTNDLIGALIDLGWLLECESEDRRQIGEAASRALNDLGAHHAREKV